VINNPVISFKTAGQTPSGDSMAWHLSTQTLVWHYLNPRHMSPSGVMPSRHTVHYGVFMRKIYGI